jgi:hypothetical protein
MKASELIKFLQRAEEDTEVNVTVISGYGSEYDKKIVSCTLKAGADGACIVAEIGCKDREKNEVEE